MNKKEFSTIAMAISSYYPEADLFPSNQAIELWYQQLKDIPYIKCQEILNKWVANNKFHPTIADIREMYTEKPDEWGKGWEEVIKAIHKYGVYDEEGALNSFSAITKEAVMHMGFKNICLSDSAKLSVERANFRQIYTEIANRKIESLRVPEHLRIQEERKVMLDEKNST